MSYPSFPSIQKPSYSPSNEDVYPEYDDVVLSSKADGGYTVTRPRNTRTQMGNRYVWPAMPAADYAMFKAFVTTTINYAGIFVWTDPVTGAAKNVKLTEKPRATNPVHGFWQVEISIQEV